VVAPELRTDRTFDGTVATVAAPGAALGALSATIDWGDGATSTASLTGTEATTTSINSLYAASGSHTYARSGTYHARVTVTRDGNPVSTEFLVRVRGH
jgi:hexosaminidase